MHDLVEMGPDDPSDPEAPSNRQPFCNLQGREPKPVKLEQDEIPPVENPELQYPQHAARPGGSAMGTMIDQATRIFFPSATEEHLQVPPPQHVGAHNSETATTLTPASTGIIDPQPMVLLGLGGTAASSSGTKLPAAGEGVSKDARSPGLRRLTSDCSMVGHTGGKVKEEEDGWKLSDKRREKRKNVASIESAARTRANASHSQYERKRRQKINQRMKALQKLVPNSCENDDKVSLLEKAIEHIKDLQAHGELLNNMNNQLYAANHGNYMGNPMMMPHMHPPQSANDVQGDPMQQGSQIQSFFQAMFFPAFFPSPPPNANPNNMPVVVPGDVPNVYPPQMPRDLETLSSNVPRRSGETSKSQSSSGD